MKKVYLLLRNNNQTGPHSLEELVQLRLKPLDLIWIEGKSFSWSYPAEISALKPYVVQSNPFAPTDQAAKESLVAPSATSPIIHQAYMPSVKEVPTQPAVPPAKKVYVSMPGNVAPQQVPAPQPQQSTAADLERKAEELRKRTQAYASGNKPVDTVNNPAAGEGKPVTPVSKNVTKEDALKVKYTKPVGELEEEYSSWIYTQKSKKKKNVSWSGIVAAIAVVALLGAAFGISKYDSSVSEPIAQDEPVTQELTDKDIPNNEALIPPAAAEAEITPPQTINNEKPSSTIVEPEKKSNTSFASNISPAPVAKKEVRIPSKSAEVKAPVTSAKPVEKEKVNMPTPVENNSKATTKTKAETGVATAETPAKKKTVGAAISGFFNKFKRKVDAVQEDEGTTNQEIKSGKQPVEKPQATAPDPGTERKAMRRGDETRPAESVTKIVPAAKTNFDELVDISSNEPAEKWMLGVHGLKLTIHNRSNETLRTATVEVRYFSEQNDLLEKKVLNFSNVPPLKSVTQPVPDHRLADHTEYRFISANN